MKRWLLLLFACLLILQGCAGKEAVSADKLKVVASIYPMAEFARAAGGDRVEVTVLVPAGTEAHDWQPAASDIKKISESALFIYNGGNMEPWAAKVTESLGARRPRVLAAGAGLFTDMEKGGGAPQDHHQDHYNEEHSDAHVWLDPVLAIKQTEAVRDALMAADGKNSGIYRENTARYVERLEKLRAGYDELSARTKGQEFITMHAAFGYMAKRYGWKQMALLGLDPHAEPTPAVLAATAKLIKEKNIRYLFSEPQISDKTMREIALQTGAQVLTLDPLETAPASGGYIDGMENNLRQLAKALAADKN